MKNVSYWLSLIEITILTVFTSSCNSEKKPLFDKSSVSPIESAPQVKENPSDASEQFQLGMRYMNGEGGIERNETEGIKWIERAANQGYDDAEFELGIRYWEGKGTVQDFAKGAKWLSKASNKDNSMAQMILAEAYRRGTEIPKNDNEAIRLSKLLVGAFPSFGSILGGYYAEGKAVPLDHKIAAEWFRKAADYGDQEGMIRLAYCYANGEGVPKSDVEAVKWFLKAADKGDIAAIENLAYRYRTGEGVKKDLTESATWYKLAADKGSTNAQGALGQCYLNGWGIPEDKVEGARWLQKSAEQGNSSSQRLLGACYSFGWGVPMDRILAYKWSNLAAASGNKESIELRDQIAESMSEEEITEAQRLSREWHKTHNEFVK